MCVCCFVFIDPRVRKIGNEVSSCPGIFSKTLRFYYVASSPGSPLPHLLDRHRKLVGRSAIPAVLCTHTNTYMLRFSPSVSGFFGPSRCLVPTPGLTSHSPCMVCVCVCIYTHTHTAAYIPIRVSCREDTIQHPHLFFYQQQPPTPSDKYST